MGARKLDRPPKFSLRGFLFVIMWYNIRKNKVLALEKIVVSAPPLFLLRRSTILQVGSLKYAEAELLRLEKATVGTSSLPRQSRTVSFSSLCHIYGQNTQKQSFCATV